MLTRRGTLLSCTNDDAAARPGPVPSDHMHASRRARPPLARSPGGSSREPPARLPRSMSRAGLRVNEPLSFGPVGMYDCAWEQLQPWLAAPFLSNTSRVSSGL